MPTPKYSELVQAIINECKKNNRSITVEAINDYIDSMKDKMNWDSISEVKGTHAKKLAEVIAKNIDSYDITDEAKAKVEKYQKYYIFIDKIYDKMVKAQDPDVIKFSSDAQDVANAKKRIKELLDNQLITPDSFKNISLEQLESRIPEIYFTSSVDKSDNKRHFDLYLSIKDLFELRALEINSEKSALKKVGKIVQSVADISTKIFRDQVLGTARIIDNIVRNNEYDITKLTQKRDSSVTSIPEGGNDKETQKKLFQSFKAQIVDNALQALENDKLYPKLSKSRKDDLAENVAKLVDQKCSDENISASTFKYQTQDSITENLPTVNITYVGTINKDELKNKLDISVKMTGFGKFKDMEYDRASGIGERAKVLVKERARIFVKNNKEWLGIGEKVEQQTADDRFTHLKEAIKDQTRKHGSDELIDDQALDTALKDRGINKDTVKRMSRVEIDGLVNSSNGPAMSIKDNQIKFDRGMLARIETARVQHYGGLKFVAKSSLHAVKNDIKHVGRVVKDAFHKGPQSR